MTEGEMIADDDAALGAAAVAPPMAVAFATIAADEASALEAAWASKCGTRLQRKRERSRREALSISAYCPLIQSHLRCTVADSPRLNHTVQSRYSRATTHDEDVGCELLHPLLPGSQRSSSSRRC